MKRVEYLYGVNVDTKAWETMYYKDVLELKIQLATDNIKTLNKAHYLAKDSTNINDCVRAIRFNENLLKEFK